MMVKVDLNIEQLCRDLELLAEMPGPTRSVAKISPNDPKLEKEYDYPMFQTLSNIIKRMKDDGADLYFNYHNGNVVVVGGLGEKPTESQIKRLPVTLGAHLDEITYIIKKPTESGLRTLIPICNPPKDFIKYEKVRIFGYRSREFGEVGRGKITLIHKEVVKNGKRSIEREYQLETNAPVREGDMVIQDYGPIWNPESKKYDIDSTLKNKALDDRAGCLVHLYVVKELSKQKIPSKAILVGDEEGVPEDVAWGRLTQPTFEKFCRYDGVTIICDGVDGQKLFEFKRDFKDMYLPKGLVLPYTSAGKGAGDPGIFAVLRDVVIPLARDEGYELVTTTDYVSRSFDPKIVEKFPLVGFIDWSNGKVGDEEAVCHLEESISIRQVVNLIGGTANAVAYFNKVMM